jgi:hypothetical protein
MQEDNTLDTNSKLDDILKVLGLKDIPFMSNIKSECIISDSLKIDETDCLEIREISNDYFGVFITKDVKCWDVLATCNTLTNVIFKDQDNEYFKENPVSVWANLLEHIYSENEHENIKEVMNYVLYSLFPREKIPIEELSKDRTKFVQSIFDTFTKNSFLSSKGYGLYKLPSFINHSCIPNVIAAVNENGTINIVALEDIKKDQEIVWCYAKDFSDIESVKIELQECYGFECKCARCIGNIPKEEYIKQRVLQARTCKNCGKQSGKRCNICKATRYCSDVCQKEDWKKRHKKDCKLFKEGFASYY